MRVRVIRFDGNGAAIGDDCLVDLAKRGQCDAEIVMRFRIVWLDGNGAVIGADGFVGLAQRF